MACNLRRIDSTFDTGDEMSEKKDVKSRANPPTPAREAVEGEARQQGVVERHRSEPASSSRQSDPEPERPPTPRELEEASPDRLDDPPQAEGERDEG